MSSRCLCTNPHKRSLSINALSDLERCESCLASALARLEGAEAAAEEEVVVGGGLKGLREMVRPAVAGGEEDGAAEEEEEEVAEGEVPVVAMNDRRLEVRCAGAEGVGAFASVAEARVRSASVSV